MPLMIETPDLIGEKPTTRYQDTAAPGGKGGHAFDFKKPGRLVRRIEAWAVSDRMRGVRIVLTDGTTLMAGQGHGTHSTFEFNLGESIDQLNLYSSSYKGGRSGGFDFKTSKGRSFAAGPRKEGKVQASGGYLGGVFGHHGSDVDRLGFAYATDVNSYLLKDVKYDLDKATAAGLRPVALETAALINATDRPLPMGWEAPVEITTVKHWTSAWSIKVGVKASGEAGVPLLANGKWEVSAETSFQYSWGASETLKVGQKVTVPPFAVPPGKMFRCSALVRSGKIDVPYTATAVLTYDDGTAIEQPESGVFDGAITVDLTTEVSGPFDIDPSLRALGAGRHEGVVYKDVKHPELHTQTVIVAE